MMNNIFYSDNDKTTMNKKSSSQELIFTEILHITNNFSNSNVIVDGGLGIVYKGVLPSGKLVAIKKLGKARDLGSKDFLAEMEAMGRARHKNSIPLLGSCSFGGEKLLIYEFMENGSLNFWVSNKQGSLETLNWELRMQIALGTAKGLAFLYHGVIPPIIHQDVKASIILLDHDFEPRIADFGLARILSFSKTHVTTEIAGTLGYIAPEYGQSFTTKGDVYGFGVLMLEIVTGKYPTGSELKNLEAENLVGWVRKMVEKEIGMVCLDGKVTLGNEVAAQMLFLLHLALQYINDDPFERPIMQEAVQSLEYTAVKY